MQVVTVTKVVRKAPIQTPVFDIGVEGNHNFFIRPKGSTHSVLVHNCHKLTPAAQEAYLKTVEEPPPTTMWILASTDPEKLKSALRGRCGILNMKEVSREAVSARLAYIADKEGFKYKEGLYNKIAELTGGHMRNAVQTLENVRAADRGGKFDSKDLLRLVASDSAQSTDEGMEATAVKMLIAIYGLSLSSMWKYSAELSSDWVGFVNKLIFVNMYLIESTVHGNPRVVWHTPLNTGFKTSVKRSLPDFDVKSKLTFLTALHADLMKLRADMVTSSGPERGLIVARLGEFITKNKQGKSKRKK